MIRTKLADRVLPRYSLGEEQMNMITHIVGGGIGIVSLIACVGKAILAGDPLAVITAAVFGVSMVTLYTMSSIYHGMRPGTGKKVMQIMDHCTIYFLIAGTYTPIVLCAVRPLFPTLGWGLFALQWGLACIAATLTAIDLHNYRVFSMICYIGMGWSILPFMKQAMAALSPAGFWLVFAGGVAYTVGAVLFGIGKTKKWMHSVFHIFVVLGSLLHAIAIFQYVL